MDRVPEPLAYPSRNGVPDDIYGLMCEVTDVANAGNGFSEDALRKVARIFKWQRDNDLLFPDTIPEGWA